MATSEHEIKTLEDAVAILNRILDARRPDDGTGIDEMIEFRYFTIPEGTPAGTLVTIDGDDYVTLRDTPAKT